MRITRRALVLTFPLLLAGCKGTEHIIGTPSNLTEFRTLDSMTPYITRSLTAQKAHEKGLEFLAHVAPGIPEVLLGDPLRLGQILTNFVNNAVKFTERGEIRLEIEQLERTGEKVQLKFSVRSGSVDINDLQFV